MKILLTGATGYIGKRLLPVLINNGHTVVCCVRDKRRFTAAKSLQPYIQVIEIDLLQKDTLAAIPSDIDGAYYLVHSMSASKNYQQLEEKSARNFREVMNKTMLKHLIYLSGIVNEKHLSDHLASRKNVEHILSGGDYAFTTLRAGIIIGSGSASFEIIRDLVEKLPIMVAPKWLNTKCQPIGIANVIELLQKSLFNEKTYHSSFDIGGPDVLTYKQMLLDFAQVRGLKRRIYILPVMTPRLSSYWLYFVTSTSYKLATALVDSMKIEVVCRASDINTTLNVQPLPYKAALRRSFDKIERNEVLSSWKDSLISGRLSGQTSDFLHVPIHGCFKDSRRALLTDKRRCIDKIWRLGGKTGWYYGNRLWQLRGHLDKLSGGVGLRRGRTHTDRLEVGDAVDFWRVIYANKEEGRLLLYAEMKLPGEAWLEFRTNDNTLEQTATFRPKGVAGRLYWYSVLPFHHAIFKGLINQLIQ